MNDTRQLFIEKVQEYKNFTRTTVRYGDSATDIRHVAYPALGLVGEIGELAEYLDKIDPTNEEFIAEFISELGDILWMSVRLADSLFPDGVLTLLPLNYEFLLKGHLYDGSYSDKVFILGRFDTPKEAVEHAVMSMVSRSMELSGKVAKIVRKDKSTPTKAVEVVDILDDIIYLCILLAHWVLQGYPMVTAYSHQYTDNIDSSERTIALFEMIENNTRKLSARVENNTIKGDGHDR